MFFSVLGFNLVHFFLRLDPDKFVLSYLDLIWTTFFVLSIQHCLLSISKDVASRPLKIQQRQTVRIRIVISVTQKYRTSITSNY